MRSTAERQAAFYREALSLEEKRVRQLRTEFHRLHSNNMSILNEDVHAIERSDVARRLAEFKRSMREHKARILSGNNSEAPGSDLSASSHPSFPGQSPISLETLVAAQETGESTTLLVSRTEGVMRNDEAALGAQKEHIHTLQSALKCHAQGVRQHVAVNQALAEERAMYASLETQLADLRQALLERRASMAGHDDHQKLIDHVNNDPHVTSFPLPVAQVDKEDIVQKFTQLLDTANSTSLIASSNFSEPSALSRGLNALALAREKDLSLFASLRPSSRTSFEPCYPFSESPVGAAQPLLGPHSDNTLADPNGGPTVARGTTIFSAGVSGDLAEPFASAVMSIRSVSARRSSSVISSGSTPGI